MTKSKAKTNVMTMEAAARIRRHEALGNGGQIPKGKFGSRADAAVQRREAMQKNKS